MGHLFLEQPNLPRFRARLCALAGGEPYIQIHRGLEKLGIEPLPVAPHPGLPPPTSRHADLQLHPLGNDRVIVARGADALWQALSDRGFRVEWTARPPGDRYPEDVALCCFALGERLYAGIPHTDPGVLARYPFHRRVNQGYARCSTCIVSERAVITADRGIAAAVRQDGGEALQIRPGHIALPGYSHGFLGGCAGLIDRNLLAFTGDLDTHPDGGAIRRFCHIHGVETLCLTRGELLDIGGIIPLLEEDSHAGV